MGATAQRDIGQLEHGGLSGTGNIRDNIAGFQGSGNRYTMNIEDFHTTRDARLFFTRQQGSDFAKKVAGDFNPIHHPDSKRFCIPGDLLFAVILHHYGLRQKMDFRFAGMVDDSVQLLLPECEDEHTEIKGDNGKTYLTIDCSGEVSQDPKLIADFTRRYVEFSGKTFPDILIPLVEKHGVMVNPDRPLVIYDRMSFELDRIDIRQLDLKLADARLEHSGKRGDVTLEYELLDRGERVGHGCKHMALGGLRPYEQSDVERLIASYEEDKKIYA
jgi:hypothetical protein